MPKYVHILPHTNEALTKLANILKLYQSGENSPNLVTLPSTDKMKRDERTGKTTTDKDEVMTLRDIRRLTNAT